jgi:PQQ system protein
MAIMDYARLLRPSVLKQFNLQLIKLVNELPTLDRHNKATLGRLFVHGGLRHATEGPDGRMQAQVRILPEELIWSPSVVVMPHGGDLEIEVTNDDPNPHCALLPSNGDKQ